MSADDLASEFQRLKNQDLCSAFRRRGALGSNIGLTVANNFQPGMWSIRVSRYRCPMDVFQDDDLLRRAIERAWIIWPARVGANPSNLRRMLKTFPYTAGVSNFRPTLARAVIERYSEAGSTVLDFSAGFGGRLVGSLTLHRSYLGIEPCPDQVDGMRETIRALWPLRQENASARIYQGRAESVLTRFPSGSVDLVFSSPPYYDWERYSDDNSQSFVRYASYVAWLAGFLTPCVEESYRVLRPKGRMVLNVSGGWRKPSREDVVRIAERSGFVLLEEVPMLLARVPYLHPRRLGAFKAELLVVFQKRTGVRR
jgi:SAM-dependent methyltransferase